MRNRQLHELVRSLSQPGFHLLRRAGCDDSFINEVARVMEYREGCNLYRGDLGLAVRLYATLGTDGEPPVDDLTLVSQRINEPARRTCPTRNGEAQI